MRFFLILFLLLGLRQIGFCQQLADTGYDQEMYYLGFNPVAAFTAIRGNFTSSTLPAFTNMEPAISIFGGKIWAQNYNVETRLAIGSPAYRYILGEVQSGLMYCRSVQNSYWNPYAGLFLRLYSLHNRDKAPDYVSTGIYAVLGNRIIHNHFFVDCRINQHLFALSWSSGYGSKAHAGFNPGIYNWSSPYVPLVSINTGFFFR